MSAPERLRRLRRFLQLAAVGVFLSTVVELLSVEHYDELWQFAPFVLCALGIGAVIADWRRPGPGSERWVRGTLVVVALGSLLGVYFHLAGNFEFAREIDPQIGEWSLAKDLVSGGNPLLASGVLVVGGALGLAASYARAPVMAPGPTPADAPDDAAEPARLLSPAAR